MFPIKDNSKDIDWFNAWVKRQHWINAKTYANTTPHEYIVCNLGSHVREDFEKAFRILENNMVQEKFFRTTYGYFYPGDGYKYFAADGKGWKEDRNILNRALANRSY